MRWLIWLALLLWTEPWSGAAELTTPPPGAGEASHCPDCHPQEHLEFQHSRMAHAAKTADFIREWEEKERAERCLECHAPSGGEGVVCRDCHGEAGHPYPRLSTPKVCARCHDAPGELTVRSFLQSPAAGRDEDCLDCHLPEAGTGHDFLGPTRAGYLNGIARVHVAMRRDTAGDTLLVRISHRAGHALPGGTTGRAVWLQIEYQTGERQRLAGAAYRFGWDHDAALHWRDMTLPPGPGKVIEIPLQSDAGAAYIEARLVYRFRPGPLTEPDPREVELDRTLFALPVKMEESR